MLKSQVTKEIKNQPDTKLRYECVSTPFGLLEGDMAWYPAVKASKVRKLVFRVPDVIHHKYE